MSKTETNIVLARPARRLTLPRLTIYDVMVILAVTIWSINFAVIKAALDVLPPFVFNILRFSIGTVLLGTALIRSGEPLTLSRTMWLPIVLTSFWGNIVYQAIFTYGLHHTSVANSVLLLSTGPVWVLLYNVGRKVDRIGRGGFLGIGLTLGGVLLVVASRYSGQLSIGGLTLAGDALSLIASFVWGINVLATRYIVRSGSILTITFWSMAIGTAFQFPIALPDLLTLHWSTVTPAVLAAIVYSAIGSVTVASLFWNRGVKELGASKASIYTNLQPIIAAATAIVFLGEAFTPWLAVGTAIVLVGLWLVRRS